MGVPRIPSLFLCAALWVQCVIFVLGAPTDIPSAASFYVPSLPDLQPHPDRPLSIFAGHLSSDPDASKAAATDVTAHLYFVMIKNRRVADKERIMFWFNGGPGCSSFDGLMMENGPWRVDGNGGLKVADGGWEEYTTMVYVDQPAGTGFSYTATNHYVQTLEEASQQLLVFLHNFYDVFPEYKSMETYFGGESYAGQYLPYFADAVLNSDLYIPLRGVAIGNGWIDSRRQYPSYIDYLVRVGILSETSDEYKEAKEKTESCIKGFENYVNEPINIQECEGLIMDVAKVREKQDGDKQMCMNIYDVRLDDTAPACGMNWPPDIKPITEYLDRSDVVSALHAEAHSGSWVECRGQVHVQFREERSNSSITVLPKVLERIPVLLFAGDQDYICNYVGLENMIQAMSWNDGTGLGKVQTQSWTVDGAPAGTWVSSRNLTYAKIFNASHMAPFDLPHVSHDMILRFMNVNFSAILDGSARIPSSIGSEEKPTFTAIEEELPNTPITPGKTPEQDKAMWEAYYNAGSAALVLVVVFGIIGAVVWFRRRRGGSLRLPGTVDFSRRPGDFSSRADAEESIPLNASDSMGNLRNSSTPRLSEDGDGRTLRGDDDERKDKGKGRALLPPEPIFDVGSDDEDGYRDEHEHGRKDA
ncbi:alpha/beta-hydrolase [Schizophyllum commune H4-8]|uniref:alpha/beta-hydrolase n=1 Tax=Schizophyllum commune (strain H4-8 / FGSC 9210) TaxID=578458 RepID=UPI00215FB681|nr:alpha/beta-hydrolase [Schizophyllum commune H4-8]KAI5893580.1 alpha/beta-hydrolase [Schizophyllum commune H4-8]